MTKAPASQSASQIGTNVYGGQITCHLISRANLSLFHTCGTKIRFPHLILHQVPCPTCVCVHTALQLTSLATNLFRPKVWIPVWGQDREKEAELENLVTWRERMGSRGRALGDPMTSVQWLHTGKGWTLLGFVSWAVKVVSKYSLSFCPRFQPPILSRAF